MDYVKKLEARVEELEKRLGVHEKELDEDSILIKDFILSFFVEAVHGKHMTVKSNTFRDYLFTHTSKEMVKDIWGQSPLNGDTFRNYYPDIISDEPDDVKLVGFMKYMEKVLDEYRSLIKENSKYP